MTAPELLERVARLQKRIDLHRAGEALSGHRVAHVDVPVGDLEAVLRTLSDKPNGGEAAPEASGNPGDEIIGDMG